MRVLHVLQYSLPRLIGYTIRTDGLLRAQQALGLDVVALTGSLQPSPDGEPETIKGVRYLRLRQQPEETRNGIRQMKLLRALSQNLSRAIRQERPDVIHVHSPAYNALAGLWNRRRSGIPVVYELRGLWEDAAVDQGKIKEGSLYYKAGKALESYVLRNADGVATICSGLRDEIVSRGISPAKVAIVGNGVDIEMLQPQPRDEQLARELGFHDGPTFGFIGSLFRYEGVEEFVSALPAVLRQVPGARFLVLGGGEREREVESLITTLGIAASVVYRPRVPHSEVPRYYSVLDALVYPRRKNRITDLVTPLKPMEAMAMGKLAIASDVGGHKELIDHGRTGLLYQADNEQSLIDTLVLACQDAPLRLKLAEQGRQHVLEHRNWVSVSRPYLDLYSRLVPGRRAGAG
ncbi:MAG: glycosyltransferase, exosortase A system-associated [Acidobacteria bacterium]|nr:glycosyltransferase, exosortase A system-associated [Acidobacteriota bacterium]